jgi:hypothetical protein
MSEVNGTDPRPLLRERVRVLDTRDVFRRAGEELDIFVSDMSVHDDLVYAMEVSEPIDAATADEIVRGCRTLETLRALDRSVVDGPLAVERQEWIDMGARAATLNAGDFRPVDAAVELHFGKPCHAGLFSSTALPGGSMWWCHGEWRQGPWRRWLLEVEPAAAATVREIRSAADWVALVEAFPRHERDGLVYADWGAIGAVHAGVHMTAAAIAAIQTLRFNSAVGTIARSEWDVESTVWLRWSFSGAELLAEGDR